MRLLPAHVIDTFLLWDCSFCSTCPVSSKSFESAKHTSALRDWSVGGWLSDLVPGAGNIFRCAFDSCLIQQSFIMIAELSILNLPKFKLDLKTVGLSGIRGATSRQMISKNHLIQAGLCLCTFSNFFLFSTIGKQIIFYFMTLFSVR